MEYSSQLDLYKALIPAFNVKKRLNALTSYKDIKNEDIWKYLSLNVWKNSYDLTLSKMVNDIITLDIEEIFKHKGELQ